MDEKQNLAKKIIVTDGCFESPIVYRNFWSSKVLDNLNGKIQDWRHGELLMKCQLTSWPPGVIADSGPILIFDLSNDEEFLADIKSELNVIYDIFAPDWVSGSMHIFLNGGYIPWHDDSHCCFTSTTYLNREEWNYNWGGALMYKNKHGELHAEFPEYNKMIVQSGYFSKKNNMAHGTTHLSSSSIPRISLELHAGFSDWSGV